MNNADLAEKIAEANGLTKADVDGFASHGTGTLLGDPIEAGALGAVDPGLDLACEEPFRASEVGQTRRLPVDGVQPHQRLDRRGGDALAAVGGRRDVGREGVINFFLVCEPLRGWREVRVSEQRTRIDWAHCVKDLVDVHYPEAAGLVLVMDQLNTHTPASLYEAFPPAEAKRLADKLEIHYTPKHASWLNMVEIEIGVNADAHLAGAKVRFDGTRELLDEKWTYWQGPRFASALPIKWKLVEDPVDKGPVLMELVTYRYRGHSMSDPAKYRSREEVQEMREKHDPIDGAREELLKRGVTEERLKDIEKQIRSKVGEAADFAESSPEPEMPELYTDVLVESY